jgi:uncharacterized protein
MKILVSGASGLIGSVLVPTLSQGGHQVRRLVRKSGRLATDEIGWDPAAGRIDTAALEGFDAVVHLAGENVAGGRWTAQRKADIRNSRVQGTQLLAEALAGIARPPRVLASASAIGIYGHRGTQILEEDAASGSGFLAEVCREWEASTEAAERSGIRVVHLRIGVVLSAAGGALGAVLPLFRIGAGGVVGDGDQYLSWIAIDDVVAAIQHVLRSDAMSGAVNVVAPNPVTNREYTKALGRVLSRPTFVPLPAFAARLMFGEMADELLLSSTRVSPQQLLGSGFDFAFPQLDDALRHLLGVPAGKA